MIFNKIDEFVFWKCFFLLFCFMFVVVVGENRKGWRVGNIQQRIWAWIRVWLQILLSCVPWSMFLKGKKLAWLHSELTISFTWTRYLGNTLREFLQIWPRCPLGFRDEIIKQWMSKVKFTLTPQNTFLAITHIHIWGKVLNKCLIGLNAEGITS